MHTVHVLYKIEQQMDITFQLNTYQHFVNFTQKMGGKTFVYYIYARAFVCKRSALTCRCVIIRITLIIRLGTVARSDLKLGVF